MSTIHQLRQAMIQAFREEAMDHEADESACLDETRVANIISERIHDTDPESLANFAQTVLFGTEEQMMNAAKNLALNEYVEKPWKKR